MSNRKLSKKYKSPKKSDLTNLVEDICKTGKCLNTQCNGGQRGCKDFYNRTSFYLHRQQKHPLCVLFDEEQKGF